MTFTQWEAMFPTEDHCRSYLAKNRWPEGVSCPRCGNVEVYALANFHWQCNACGNPGYRFSVLVSTIFENTNKPLRQWFRVVHLMLTSKKGMSALQIHRMMGFGSYRTAWSMCHKIRAALANQDFRKLMGIVEVDETFIGGEDSNRHLDKKKNRKGGYGDKFAVIGAVERGGNCVARVLNTVSKYSMEKFVQEMVGTDVSLLATDEATGYYDLKKMGYKHGTSNHSKKKYVVGAVHTNTIEGFWSMVKRGIMGSYHKVSKRYLPLYIAEFQFRYNNRENPDIFGQAIKGC